MLTCPAHDTHSETNDVSGPFHPWTDPVSDTSLCYVNTCVSYNTLSRRLHVCHPLILPPVILRDKQKASFWVIKPRLRSGKVSKSWSQNMQPATLNWGWKLLSPLRVLFPLYHGGWRWGEPLLCLLSKFFYNDINSSYLHLLGHFKNGVNEEENRSSFSHSTTVYQTLSKYKPGSAQGIRKSETVTRN